MQSCSQAGAKAVNACFKVHPNGAYIEYFGAKTCEFSHLPALTQNLGYVIVLMHFTGAHNS